MPGTPGPNLGLTWGWAPHEDGWGVNGFNPNSARLDTLVQLFVISETPTPPGSPVNGVRYIVGAAATGAWAGFDKWIAVYLTTGTPGWQFYSPQLGWRAWNDALQYYVRFDGSNWVPDTGGFTVGTPAAGDVLVYDDTVPGFVNVRPMRAISFGSDPAALLAADQTLFLHRFGFAFKIDADFADYLSASSTFGATAAAAASVTLIVQKALTSAPLAFTNVGTILIGTGTVNGTFNSSGLPLNFAKGDVLRIVAPHTPDTALTGPYGTIVGYEP
jgi:uncharacterized protein DUF2793